MNVRKGCLLLALACLAVPASSSAESAGDPTTAKSPESLLFVQTLSLKASKWTQTFRPPAANGGRREDEQVRP
jgi:hypothetical protein